MATLIGCQISCVSIPAFATWGLPAGFEAGVLEFALRSLLGCFHGAIPVGQKHVERKQKHVRNHHAA